MLDSVSFGIVAAIQLIEGVEFGEGLRSGYLHIEISREGKERYFFSGEIKTDNHDGVCEILPGGFLIGFSEKKDIGASVSLSGEGGSCAVENRCEEGCRTVHGV